MSKGEDVMKPNKEQKGNHAVLVIAVGKHPKMGPGERNYKKDKSMKKAFNILKRKKTAAERQQAYEQRKARREQRQKEMDAYNAGTASEEVRQKIDQSRANRESGVNQNLRYANKETGGSSRKKMPKKPFDVSHFDRWVKQYALGASKGDTKLTDENARAIARKLGMNPSSLRSKNFEGVDIGKLKQVMQDLGKHRYNERENQRETGMVSVYDNMEDMEDPYTDEMMDEYGELLDEKHGPRPPVQAEITDEEREQIASRRKLERLGMDADVSARRADFESGEYNKEIEPMGDLGKHPSTVFTIPYGASGGVEGGRKKEISRRYPKMKDAFDRELGPRGREGETTFQEEYAGFMRPRTSTRLSNPYEEEEEAEDFPEYGQFALSESPMDLAFRLLKDEQKEKTFMRQCYDCGQMKGPNGVCRCDRR